MADFSTPGQPNPDDIEPSESNFIKPGKRPQSSISPVIFTGENGRVRLIAGASGGPHITTAVSLVSNARVSCPRTPTFSVLGFSSHVEERGEILERSSARNNQFVEAESIFKMFLVARCNFRVPML